MTNKQRVKFLRQTSSLLLSGGGCSVSAERPRQLTIEQNTSNINKKELKVGIFIGAIQQGQACEPILVKFWEKFMNATSASKTTDYVATVCRTLEKQFNKSSG